MAYRTVNNNGTDSARKDVSRPWSKGMLPQWLLEIIRPIVGFSSRLFFRIEFVGVENVPLDGGVIIAGLNVRTRARLAQSLQRSTRPSSFRRVDVAGTMRGGVVSATAIRRR